jgi:hypothetical protein
LVVISDIAAAIAGSLSPRLHGSTAAEDLPRLEKPQPRSARILAPRLNPPHAQKTLQSSLSMANSQLRRDRHLEQTAAMVPPSVVIKDGMCGRRFARSFSRSAATERLVNARLVVGGPTKAKSRPRRKIPIVRPLSPWRSGRPRRRTHNLSAASILRSALPTIGRSADMAACAGEHEMVRVWYAKMLVRIARGDLESKYRRVELLFQIVNAHGWYQFHSPVSSS